ncbi:hypothetical protein HanXRQr2_Chr11g0481121 [Helianthus annuus]|uniref:Uncharacterized protein n=1 Tax=Helianthus annuus TaxID=4232 RepID=A0A9K3MZ84_HELAN|nr:hypothetical protein HanXRQr2_Chr11g0481121 [Helianthus annuus]
MQGYELRLNVRYNCIIVYTTSHKRLILKVVKNQWDIDFVFKSFKRFKIL